MQVQSLAAPRFERVANAVWALSQRHWRLVMVAMLVLLHVAALRGVADGWARALLLAHVGMLLLWQPILRSHQNITGLQALVIAVIAAAITIWLSWWLLAFWVVVLAGLVGGKVFLHASRWQRRFYLLVLFYLTALLTVLILPELAPQRELQPEIRAAAEWGLPVLLALLLVMPAEADAPEAPLAIDFFYSVFLMLVFGVLILGSFAFLTLGQMSYLEALTYMVFVMAGGMLLVGVAWNPRTGFAGLNVFFSRYLFSIGLPVEKWLYFLAELSQVETRPERFLAEGVAGIVRLPWVSGAEWRSATDKGEAGTRSPHEVGFESSDLRLVIYSRYRAGAALHWHLHLLGQLLAEFYMAKLREQKLRDQSYLQAVHETGARMTHDVKNLLQSLNVLCNVVGEEGGHDRADLIGLVRRQLPAIAQRLSATLDRLQRPAVEDEQWIAAEEWWRQLTRRFQGGHVEFAAGGIRTGTRVPRAVLDAAAENLIGNAIAKRGTDGAVRIRVQFESDDAGTKLRVTDSGQPVPVELQRVLIRSPVRSNSGLGIGLYQAGRLAEAGGYRLELESNEPGRVAFLLSGRDAG